MCNGTIKFYSKVSKKEQCKNIKIALKLIAFICPIAIKKGTIIESSIIL